MPSKNKKYKFIQQSFKAQIPETNFIPPTAQELDKKTEKQMMDFSALLDTLSSLEEKKKALWKQIYENAVTDRNNAYIIFADLYKDVHNDVDRHAIHGQTLTKYLERMEKSNAQLIKLAEMIDDVATEDEEWATDEDTLYERITKEQKGNK